LPLKKGYMNPSFPRHGFLLLPCPALSQKGLGVSAKVCQVQTNMTGLCCAEVQTNTWLTRGVSFPSLKPIVCWHVDLALLMFYWTRGLCLAEVYAQAGGVGRGRMFATPCHEALLRDLVNFFLLLFFLWSRCNQTQRFRALEPGAEGKPLRWVFRLFRSTFWLREEKQPRKVSRNWLGRGRIAMSQSMQASRLRKLRLTGLQQSYRNVSDDGSRRSIHSDRVKRPLHCSQTQHRHLARSLVQQGRRCLLLFHRIIRDQ
jgi:hypothetical protein